MLIAVADTETTGLLMPDGTPGDHRIIEACVGLYDLHTRKRVDLYLQRIHPMRSIAPAAQAVHKISIQDLESCPPWEKVAGNFRSFIERGDLVAGHNWDGFDKPFVDGELERIKLPKLTRPTFDTMLSGRWATPMGNIPNLGALCWACEIPYDTTKAHAAEYDVDVNAQALFRGLDWGWFKIEAPAVAIAA